MRAISCGQIDAANLKPFTLTTGKNYLFRMYHLNNKPPIIALVDKVLDTKRTNLDTDISDLENEIDKLVYALYGLTDDEIAIVEGNVLNRGLGRLHGLRGFLDIFPPLPSFNSDKYSPINFSIYTYLAIFGRASQIGKKKTLRNP